ncbi:cellulase family glycosylhydrolase [Flagellimonas nanhaiensis]|uniref:Glycosyl hydrolase family 5 n=1 Tax=Flagellimonas nanhaiensis TaxID=2292706 RepID=A0A371JMR1_9FLAO|nr:cellulase family glycosylhydrolase [Allomuricauda nanhaiensis]RDY58432.1 glycosyl hydrolase family 5 [Allomuricauda nanhaiensis]
MIHKKNIYRAMLVISFLAINAVIIYGIAAAWSFLNTGADKSSMLHIGQDLEMIYQPKIKWTLEKQKGRKMEKQTLVDLEKDYLGAWYAKNLALNNYVYDGIADYYTQDARSSLLELLEHNKSIDIQTKSTTLLHHPTLEFYSLDGKLVVLTDHNVEQYDQVYESGNFIHAKKSKSTYKVIMLLEDGFWRIRQLIKVSSEHLPVSVLDKTEDIPVQGLKGINYYPKEQAWNMFGDQFNEQAIKTDFALLEKMDMNAIRIFVPYEASGGANLKNEYLEQLSTLLDIAQEHNLKVLITLFDFYGNYSISDWTLTHRHAEQLVTHLKDHSSLLGWDIKNEPDLDFEQRSETLVKAWLTEMVQQIREWDASHPITIGWSNPGAATHLSEYVDFVSFHYYEDAEELPARYSKLKENVDKPIVLQEYGKSSYSGFWNLFLGSQSGQAKYHSNIQTFLNKEQLPFFIWTLHDFDHIPNSVVGKLPWRKAYQKRFGLLNNKGEKKPAYDVIIKNGKGDN